MNIKNVLFCCFLQTPLTGEYVFRKPTFSLVVEQEMDLPGLPLNWQLVCRQMSSPGVLIIWRLPYICSFISLSTLLTNIFARADSFADAIEVPEWYFLDVNYFTKNNQQKQNILLQDSFCFPCACSVSFLSTRLDAVVGPPPRSLRGRVKTFSSSLLQSYYSQNQRKRSSSGLELACPGSLAPLLTWLDAAWVKQHFDVN